MNNFAKMRLPGETPWGEIVEMHDDGSATLRIDNKLFHEYSSDEKREFLGVWDDLPKLHDFKQNDRVLCRKDEYGFWVPVSTGCAGRA